MNSTHSNKSTSYDIGRPNYPDEFFDYVYDAFGQAGNLTIADIGAGTGKITRRFLEKGSEVFAVEPDKSMMEILKANLTNFPNLTALEHSAESTGIVSESVELIFCGNSYMWFDRSLVVPEFQRIVRSRDKANIIIARLGAGRDVYSDEFLEIDRRFRRPVEGREADNSAPFRDGVCIEKAFEYVVSQSYDEFLHGCLSASYAPSAADDGFEEYCHELRQLFDKYSKGGRLDGTFKLFCKIGRVEDLVL